jgi:NitT/TauT family transport system substrate-binding protein
MKITTIVIVLALLMISNFFAGCIDQKKEKMVTLKVGYVPTIAFGPIFIANDEGYFTDQGIRIELIKFQSGPQAIPSLVQGEIDVSSTTISPSLFNVVARGTNIKIVADKGSTGGQCDYNALVVRKDLYDSKGLTTIEQLKGKKIAVASRPNYLLIKVLGKANLTSKDIEPVDMGFPEMVVAFENNAIDAAVVTEPYLYQVLKTGKAKILVLAGDIIPNFSGYPLVFGPNLLEKNPDLGKRFMVAYLKGVKQYNEGKTQRNLEILRNYTQLDNETLQQSCWGAIRQDGYIEKEPIMQYQDWLLENKYIDVRVSDEQLIDMRFVEYANQALKTDIGHK